MKRMLSSVQKTTGLRQGSKTSTVLTNRSNFITIVTDEPYSARRGTRSSSEPLRIRKGLRPLNKSTLCIEDSPFTTSYVSCMKSSFSGNRSIRPSRRPPAYPSQHTSQFDIAITNDHVLDTHSRMTYIHHDVIPTKQLHEHNQRWNVQMSGTDMLESTRQSKCSEMTFDTTYSTLHDKLGMDRGPGVQKMPPTRRKFDILTGELINSSRQEDFHLQSRNRILHNIRHGQDQAHHPFTLG